MENLLDPDSKMDVEKAKTIATLAQVAVNSAKVELQFAQMVGSKGTGFIPIDGGEEPKAIPEGTPKKKQETEPQSGKAPLPLFGVHGLSQ
jgi:hypothetical protein